MAKGRKAHMPMTDEQEHCGLLQNTLKRGNIIRIFWHWVQIGIDNAHPSWFSCVMGTGILGTYSLYTHIQARLFAVSGLMLLGLLAVLWVLVTMRTVCRLVHILCLDISLRHQTGFHMELGQRRKSR